MVVSVSALDIDSWRSNRRECLSGRAFITSAMTMPLAPQEISGVTTRNVFEAGQL